MNKIIHKPNTNKKGFTVMEMVIYMAILSIFLLVLTEIFVSILDVQLESEATSSINHDGRYLLSRLIYDIKRAENIQIPALPGNQTNILEISIASQDYNYSLDSGNLILTDLEGTDQLNSVDTIVSDFTVRRLGNTGGKNNLKVSFTLTSRTQRKKGAETETFSTTIGIR